MMKRSIHPMPYVLRYDASTGAPNMRVSRASSDARVVQYGDGETNGADKIRYYFSPFVSEFGLSAVESAGQEGQIIVKATSYVSGFYTGFTPKISSDRALLVVERDGHFPQFRSFDWFDLHSWSRGVIPSADGKDQESTSEELNLLQHGAVGGWRVWHGKKAQMVTLWVREDDLGAITSARPRYGIHLWGAVTQRETLRELGTTMLTLCAMTIREFFLMTEDNLHHPADFVTNHATGIFFQNKVDYATWFGWRYDFIHGIQMLPVTPALLMIRTPKFCRQEWDNILLNAMLPEHMDDGLTWAWALYWSASLEAGSSGAPPSSTTSTSTEVQQEERRDDENLALYRLAMASSELSAAEGAQRAVDGLFVTRWSPTVADPKPWISVDLGSSHALSHVVLLWGEFHPSSYLLQGANVNDQWTTLAVVLGSSELLRSDLPRPTFARWLRIMCQSGGDLRLWEFQVFEDSETPMTTESSSTTSTVASTTTVATTTTTTPSEAFQKPVLSSSFRSPLEHAYRAVDGDLDSQWASAALNDQWLWVDLLGLYAVNRVVLLFGDVPQNFVPWRVLQSAPDGIKWTDRATVAGASGFIVTEFAEPVLTQWIRVPWHQPTVVCLTACSIRELTIHGHEPGATTSSSATITTTTTTTTSAMSSSSVATTSSQGTSAPVDRVNLALQRPVLASTQQLPDQYASRATDGSLLTQWTSAQGDVAPWIWVDLLGVYQVVEVAVRWSSDVAEYEIQSSPNAVDWTPVATAGGLSGQTVRTALAPTAAQWIRIAPWDPSDGAGLRRCRVYAVENVALHKPVLASSFVLPDEFAARAVDGVTGTQWRSAASSDEWIWVDLLGRHTLDHVQLLWGSQLPSSFVLEISSNGVAWSAASASQVASGSSQQVAMDGVVTQWLRVHCTGPCSLQELQVYGSPANDRLLHEESVAPILL
eukprot:Skav223553  [mRNA]  locus=scaffold1657:525650:538631:- [translate_table: standard]